MKKELLDYLWEMDRVFWEILDACLCGFLWIFLLFLEITKSREGYYEVGSNYSSAVTALLLVGVVLPLLWFLCGFLSEFSLTNIILGALAVYLAMGIVTNFYCQVFFGRGFFPFSG